MDLNWQGVYNLKDLKKLGNLENDPIKRGGIYIWFLELEGSNIKRIIYVGTAINIWGRQIEYYRAYRSIKRNKTVNDDYSTFILENMCTNENKDIYSFFSPQYYDRKYQNKFYIIGGNNYYKNHIYEKGITEYGFYYHRRKFLEKIKFSFANIPEELTPHELKYKDFLKTIERRLINHLLEKIKLLDKPNNNLKYGRYDDSPTSTCFGKIEKFDPYPYVLINKYVDDKDKEWFGDFGKEID